MLRFFSLACALALLAGCGGSSATCPVQGTVTLKGAPLDSGTISFFAADSPSPAGGALIQAGKYEIPAAQGLPPGTYRVTISSPTSSDVTPAEYAAGKRPAPPQERIPAAYNTQSKQSATIERGGKNQFDFKID
jgi:hypothetical protein